MQSLILFGVVVHLSSHALFWSINYALTKLKKGSYTKKQMIIHSTISILAEVIFIYGMLYLIAQAPLYY